MNGNEILVNHIPLYNSRLLIPYHRQASQQYNQPHPNTCCFPTCIATACISHKPAVWLSFQQLMLGLREPESMAWNHCPAVLPMFANFSFPLTHTHTHSLSPSLIAEKKTQSKHYLCGEFYWSVSLACCRQSSPSTQWECLDKTPLHCHHPPRLNHHPTTSKHSRIQLDLYHMLCCPLVQENRNCKCPHSHSSSTRGGAWEIGTKAWGGAEYQGFGGLRGVGAGTTLTSAKKSPPAARGAASISVCLPNLILNIYNAIHLR